MEIAIEVRWKDDKKQQHRGQYDIVEKKKGFFRRLIDRCNGIENRNTFLLDARFEEVLNEHGQWVDGQGLSIKKWPQEIIRVVVDDLEIGTLHRPGEVNWHNANIIRFWITDKTYFTIKGIIEKKIWLSPEGWQDELFLTECSNPQEALESAAH